MMSFLPCLLYCQNISTYIEIATASIRTTSDEVRMRQMFHVKHGVDAPPTTCMRSPKKKKAQKSMLRHSYRYQRVFHRFQVSRNARDSHELLLR